MLALSFLFAFVRKSISRPSERISFLIRGWRISADKKENEIDARDIVQEYGVGLRRRHLIQSGHETSYNIDENVAIAKVGHLPAQQTTASGVIHSEMRCTICVLWQMRPFRQMSRPTGSEGGPHGTSFVERIAKHSPAN